jgi:hypothetical protein
MVFAPIERDGHRYMAPKRTAGVGPTVRELQIAALLAIARDDMLVMATLGPHPPEGHQYGMTTMESPGNDTDIGHEMLGTAPPEHWNAFTMDHSGGPMFAANAGQLT